MSSEKHYTIEKAFHSDGCPTKFSSSGKTGRFTSEAPNSSAKKAMTSLCKKKRIMGRCSLYLVMKEITQGSKHKEYAYKATRKVKEEPGPFGNKYESHVKRITMDELDKKCKKSYKSSGRMISKKYSRNKYTHKQKSRK